MRTMFLIAVTITCCAFGQQNSADQSCGELNDIILRSAENGDLSTANDILRAPTPSQAKVLGATCTSDILVNLAVVVGSQGELTAAERLAYRAVQTLEKAFPSNDEVLIRSLHRLALARFEQGHYARATEVLQRMREIPVRAPLDRARIAGLSAGLLQLERRWKEAERAYSETLTALQEAGDQASGEFGSVLMLMSNLLAQQGRFDEALRVSDRAHAIFQIAVDAVPSDRVKLLYLRGAIYSRQNEWRAAEQACEAAISLADHVYSKSPVWMSAMLESYAFILRKNHKKQQARGIEARIAAIGAPRGGSGSIVDVRELAAGTALRR